ncbi:MAG: thiamine pyrophosphate-dependent enzyme, partial [Flavobacteriaceae bacterium]|nr:thiamine pyrophosphate-dependent enzyme [Flavobacteriaceae bacterium]
EQFKCEHLAEKGIGYGIESHIVDGNNIIEVFSLVNKLCKSMRKNPRPVLVEFKTFRMRGHEEASGTKYVPQELMDNWAMKDPISNFEKYLKKEGILKKGKREKIRDKIQSEIDHELQLAYNEDVVSVDLDLELKDVYHPFDYVQTDPGDTTENIRLVDAISQGLRQSMEVHDNLVTMGQDIAAYGGVFKITEGFVEQFGAARVRNTPICESAIVSAAMGLSIQGMKAVMEMQFADFVSTGFNPIVNYLAKVHYRWAQKADVVIRMPCGAGVGAGPFHSQTNEAWFTKTPGLKVVYPAFPYDAKGLLASSINDPNPVLFFEHKALYRSVYQDVPMDYYTLPLGKASRIKEGEDISIITYGAGVHWALEALENRPDISADLIDLRSLQPLDTDMILDSLRRTGKVLILHEDTLFGGIGSDISALIMEEGFEYLDAPVRRVGSLATPVPFAKNLEAQYLPIDRFLTELDSLYAF